MMKKRVIFVCSGNTCRSPMAEYLLKAALRKAGIADGFVVCSAGITAKNYSPASDLAVRVMRDFNPNIDKHVSQRVSQELLDSATAIFCLTAEHRDFLLSNYGGVDGKCFLVKEFLDSESRDIVNPFLGTVDDYVRIRDEINSAMDSILKFLTDGL